MPFYLLFTGIFPTVRDKRIEEIERKKVHDVHVRPCYCGNITSKMISLALPCVQTKESVLEIVSNNSTKDFIIVH